MRAAASTRAPREVVLVGGGHAHVQVLRRFAMDPPPAARLTVVLDRPIAVYSGMVPGFVAGQYRAKDLEIDVVPLARRAGARVILSRATGVDPEARRILLEGRPGVAYDLASFDVGSTVAGLDLPGVREHALPTRPIGEFVPRVDAFVDEARRAGQGGAVRVVVVGGGAGGVELAFTLQHRLGRDEGGAVEVTLVHNRPRVLTGYPDSLVDRAEGAAAARGIRLLCGRQVEAAEERAVRLDGGERLPFEALVWVAGATGQEIFLDSGLPTDERGFVQVRPTLQVVGRDGLFAVGDCATLVEHPGTPKAGVYAVRQGPYVADNLRAALAGKPLRRYTPQSDFLTLLNLGDGTALGSKWGLSFGGRWVMRLKDRIDRRFMERFQALSGDGRPTPEFEGPAMDDGGEMLCGGCAAKLGQAPLTRALARLGPGPEDSTVVLGLAAGDDAAAYRHSGGGVVVSSLDAFPAFTDDPYLVGRVGAVNAMSDLHAKGVRPRYALALVTLLEGDGEEAREESLYQALSGARHAFEAVGVTLLGGHTTTGARFAVGFSVEGTAREEDLLTNDRLEAGQVLILTKALGTGVIFHADMKGLAPGLRVSAAVEAMQLDNGEAGRIARRHGATGCTDVTGFGLLGHLAQMLRRSELSASLDPSAVPALPGAVELLESGVRSTFHEENARAGRGLGLGGEGPRPPRVELLFDPQTAGGLLFGLAPEHEAAALAALHEAGNRAAAAIGQVLPPGREPMIRLRSCDE